MQCYLVGGAVRDRLLGLEVKDRDWVVVGATPEDMLERGFKQVGADFPVFLHPQSREEYALARTERKQGQGYHGFTVYSAPDVTLEQDLLRRDLTINAMAETEDGELVDPFNGHTDLHSRILRHVSPAFAEDPLRILRTARFAARFEPLGFRVGEETLALMRDMVQQGELDHLVPERVWQEVQRALNEQAPWVFWEVLEQVGALPSLVPELAGPETLPSAIRALHCIHNRDGATAQRFAAMLFPLEEDQVVKRANAMKAPNECRDLAGLVCRFSHRLRQPDTGDMAATDWLALLEHADVWRRPERFDALLETLGCTLDEDRSPLLKRLQTIADRTRDISPRELMAQGFKGRELGQAIHRERLARINAQLES